VVESSSVSYSKIDIADLSYPSCAISSILTVDDSESKRFQGVGRPVVAPRPSLPPRSKQEEISENFPGKQIQPTTNSTSIISSIFEEEILPAGQISPVGLSGESNSI
jgi:hypothetical protein